MGGGASVIVPDEGVDKETAKAHLGETFDEAKFDSLADEGGKISKAKVHEHHDAAPMNNSALVFIKPHANSEAVRTFVNDVLTAKGCHILSEGEIAGTEIDEKKLIDQHYYAIASKATILKPEEYFKPDVLGAKFQEEFGESWDTVKSEDRVFNAMDACAKFECDAAALEVGWRAAKVVKFGGGYYCGLVTIADKPPLYVFNAFFMNMRDNFVGEGKSIYYYSIEWKSDDLSWKDFRGNLIGPTDPSKAPPDSIRGTIAAKWEEFGLTAACDGGNNGVHASASPLEVVLSLSIFALHIPFAIFTLFREHSHFKYIRMHSQCRDLLRK